MSDSIEKGRVVILGFDGMDYDLTRDMIDRGLMPHLEKLAKPGGFLPLLSVFPADSIPSWITTYTGLDPSEHGVLDHVNYLLPGDDIDEVDTSVFHTKTFWDRVSNESESEVCIINPFMAYPVWPVKGVMISGPVFIDGSIQVSDSTRTEGIKVPGSLGGIVGLPNRSNIESFYHNTLSDTREQAEFGLKMLRSQKPGLFFQTFLTSDRIQHHLWRYCDQSDPTYPGKTNVEGGLEEFFKLVDSVVGDFIQELEPDDTLLVMSDHGHGMRCTHCFNINEYLMRNDYLVSASKGKKFSRKVLLEKLKNKVLKFMNDHDLEDYISKVAKLVPNAKALKKGSHITSYSESIAYASDFAGTNPFGGICINKERVDNYELVREKLISELSELCHEGKKIFKWLKPREALYSGRHIDRYPDILYEMVPQLGTGFSLHTDLVTVNPTHKKVSGGHKANGVFFVNNVERWELASSKCKITNMYATILGLFGIDPQLPNNAESFLVKKQG
ncbi:MAG: alkaline phosphatase family protein [Gammaproteobacteria bacterium]|nr:alkaline phosphatase family protein [Gammaproteobacteria bacterium]